MSQNLSSAAVVIGALSVKKIYFSSVSIIQEFFFSIFSSGGQFVQWSRTILVEGIMGNIHHDT